MTPFILVVQKFGVSGKVREMGAEVFTAQGPYILVEVFCLQWTYLSVFLIRKMFFAFSFINET